MTVEDFKKCKHFNHWGFVPPLDPKKGGRYVHVSKAICTFDNLNYDIFADDQMNFYFAQNLDDRKKV